jgi:hypothetical protein
MRNSSALLVATAVALLLESTGSAASPDEAVLQLFEKRCSECHKNDEKPDLHGGASLRALRDNPKFITPGNAVTSGLFARVSLPEGEKKRMPKSKGAPGNEDYRLPLTPAEKDTLKAWIEGPQQGAIFARKFITDDAINSAISADLAKLNSSGGAPGFRYLTLTNLYNMTDAKGAPRFSENELALFQSAVNKLLNSLSSRALIKKAVPIDKAKTILRIELKDYGWSAAFWEHVISFYPYAILSGKEAERDASALAKTKVPRVRADWFTFALAQPPLYYEALGLPGDGPNEDAAAALERRLGVDVLGNLRAGRAIRSGFEKSGVSEGNRMIERHQQGDGGAYWKSYDFDPNRKQEASGDLFGAPLGPVGLNLTRNLQREFRQDGGEIIYTLPNGLQGYMLVNSKGNRINVGPKNIVHDSSREKDGLIINGISCMSCHKSGMFPPPADEIAAVSGIALGEQDAGFVRQLYRQDSVKASIDDDTARFQKALDACGVTGSNDEPIRALYDRFRADVTPAQLSSEFGQSGEHFVEEMAGSANDSVRLLAAKLQRGVTIPRQNFIANFNLIVNALSLGDIISVGTPAFEEFGGKKPPVAPPPAQALDILDGISLADLDERSRKQFGLPSEVGGKVVAGVVVTKVKPQSFGDLAGLKISDVITQMDRSGVGSARQASDLGQKLKHNQKLTLHVLTVSRLVTLVADAKSEEEFPGVLRGLAVSDINDEWRRVFNLTADTTGVVITVIDSDSVAIRAGLKVGDVILDMGGVRITSAKQAIELSKVLKKDRRIRLRVLKNPSEADLVLEAKN